MPIWKQGLVAVAVVVATVILAALYFPAARPLLDQTGIGPMLTRLGLPTAEAAAPEAGARSGGGAPAPTVIALPVTERAMSDVVTAIGTGRGVRSVLVAAEVTGRITDLRVQPGQLVRAGDVLAELDNAAATIARDRAALLLADAQATSARIARLQSSGTATDLQVSEASLALNSADLNLREAELALSRHAITAPIGGWVGILPVEAGDRVGEGDEIARIEDRSSLLVDFRVPERVVSRLAIGNDVSAQALADPGRALKGRISALDNRLDEASRSLAVQAAIGNADDRLRAGMAFSIAIEFTGEARPFVDPLAIQWGSDGAYVWVLRDGKAARETVRILQRSPDAVLVDAAFRPGDLVVTEGMQSLRPGADAVAAPPAPATTN